MAVYTKVSSAALTAFLRDYALGEALACEPITEGVENSNYKLYATGGLFILTLFEKRVNPADLPWFIGLMRHLAAQGFACPQPVAGRDGLALRSLCGRPAAITTFLPGSWTRHPTVADCAAVGQTLARLHRAGAGYTAVRRNALDPSGWPSLLAACGEASDTVQAGLHAELQASLTDIVSHWPQELPTGPIHADLFPDNLFFVDGAVSGVIDFLFAATDFLAYDIAICLNAWCFGENGMLDGQRSRALLAAYQAARPLLPAERAAMPVLCQGAAIRFLLTRLFDWLHTPPDALVTRKDPLEYWRKLRFHHRATGFDTYDG